LVGLLTAAAGCRLLLPLDVGRRDLIAAFPAGELSQPGLEEGFFARAGCLVADCIVIEDLQIPDATLTCRASGQGMLRLVQACLILLYATHMASAPFLLADRQVCMRQEKLHQSKADGHL
jgi:hypothetical protein